MNQNQINQVKAHIELFSTLDFTGLIASKFGDKIDLSSVMIGDYSLEEYVRQVNKIFTQFEEEIDSPYAKVMPFQYSFQNELGNGNLNQDLTNLLNQIRSGNFSGSIPQVNKLIHYQAVNGFWEKSKRKYFRTSEIDINESKEKVDLASKHVLEASTNLKVLIEKIDEQKDELTRFIKSKDSELSEIESLLSSSRQHNGEINDLYTKSSTLEERISLLAKQSEEKSKDAHELTENLKSVLDEFNSIQNDSKREGESSKKDLDKLKSDFNEALSFVESKKSFFEERNEYLNDLIGREVGSSLFETFKQRKLELIKSIRFWKWAVPISSVATILWIFFLFGNGDLNALSWQIIIVNSLKSLPAVGLLLFTISQYVKERNFQEEYAFKSAVALTINSYAEQLMMSENKDRMILSSVGKIYESPIHDKGSVKDSKLISSEAKDLIETAKSLVQTK
ncbi:DUF5336 domain-containing protein [Ferrimonas marina]|uniref:Uncharacterized protein n=1 Tax=Ferrimonas marina TaxID=299255 RepID=A0A1M5MPB0_9GAMM|nr:DUF5336 domain-containing protein [Ferrimonas marina]SHG78892.1 hypothetical protein SAMN02745129_0714 [Ferrimonas marina]